MRIGYARTLTPDQSLILQRDMLEAAGCTKVFADQNISGAIQRRPGLDRALAALNPGDTLVVCKVDRLGGSLSYLVRTIAWLGERGVGFLSLSDSVDVANADDRSVQQIAAVFAECERSLAAERTRAGLMAAKQRGQRIGRKPSLTPDQIAHARSLVEQGESPRAVARTLRVHRSTLYRHLPAGHQPGGNAAPDQREIPSR